MTLSNDLPISAPAEDAYGLDPFARAIAKSIAGLNASEGVVLAINGPWGSGKSSAINLIRHHLSDAIAGEEIVAMTFNPWWFSGAEALTFSFFRELNIAIGPSLSKEARKSLETIGEGVSGIGPVLNAANALHPGLGTLLSGGASLFGKLTKQTKTIDKEHQAVADALKKEKRRFLVVIDDIDRLSPDDALTVFRLVKSVGRLPNVIYLLSFDRALADAAVAEKFPSEGPRYLEKILQGVFDIPPVSPDTLRDELTGQLQGVIGSAETQNQQVRFWNLYTDVVAPLIATPRDVVRMLNDLNVTWPSVAGEVDRNDFLALSALKLLKPELYRGIRANRSLLTGIPSQNTRRGEQQQQRYDDALGLAGMTDLEKERWRLALRRLFPRLDSIYANTFYSSDDEALRERRVCTDLHFPSYFAYSISEDVLPAAEVAGLVVRAADTDFVKEYLREALASKRRSGKTKASLVLDELNVYARQIPEGEVVPLLSAIFSLGDELDVAADTAGRGMSDNQLRIHWLCNRLVTDRFPLERRSQIYTEAAASASLSWLDTLSERCHGYYAPRDPDRGPPQGEPLTTKEDAEQLVAMCLARIRAASADGSIYEASRLQGLLFFWKRHASSEEVKTWTDQALADPRFVVEMAEATTHRSYSTSLGWDGNGDRASRVNVWVDFDHYRDMLDCDRLEKRVDELLNAGELSEADSAILTTFKSAPRGSGWRMGVDEG